MDLTAEYLNYIIAFVWILSIIYSLLRLRGFERMSPTARVMWVAVIVLIPIVGVIAFLIAVRKQEEI